MRILWAVAAAGVVTVVIVKGTKHENTSLHQISGDHEPTPSLRVDVEERQTQEVERAEETAAPKFAIKPLEAPASKKAAVESRSSAEERIQEEDALADLADNAPDRAESTLRAILQSNPANNVALGELVFLLETSKRTDEAKDLLQEIVKKCTYCTDARLALGEIYLKEKSFEEAINLFKEASQSESARETALRKLYSAYSQSQATAPAKAVLKEILAINNTEIRRLKGLGVDTRILEEAVRADRKTLATLDQAAEKEG